MRSPDNLGIMIVLYGFVERLKKNFNAAANREPLPYTEIDSPIRGSRFDPEKLNLECY